MYQNKSAMYHRISMNFFQSVFVIKYGANLVVVYKLFVVVFYNLLIVVVDSVFGVYKQTQSLKPMHHSFLIHNPDIPLCLTKVTDEFTGLEIINNFISYSLKSQCLLERRLYITWKDCILHTSWGLTTMTVVALLVAPTRPS